VALSGEEIRRRLREFAAAWGGYAGTEKSEAPTFLNDLLACYGTERRAEGARFEEHTAGGFMDLFWPGVCIVEMKRPSEARRLREHREQMLGYWQSSGTPASPAPRYVVLCAFHRFEVWEPGAVYTEPRVAFDLVELPDHLDALLFLAGGRPVFVHDQTEVTREAVSLVTDVYGRLQDRGAADLDVLRDFVLQSVWAMFAEDMQMLPSHVFTRVLDGLLADPARSSRDDLGQLFAYLNEPHERPSEGIYAGTPYANGSLFARPARVHLEREELELLRQACESSWRKVEPAIFGALLQGALGRERQWALGAHYTAEADILKIVLPTIVEPWRERIAACRTVADVQAAQDALMRFVVLDPACGSGNFLYVAYRELRRIEAELRRRARDMRRSAGLREQETLAVYFPLTNIRGIELDPFAVQLARVTMWMGHKLAVEELDLEERVLPLVDLSGIREIIDFAMLDLEQAMGYSAALDVVRFQVKPERDRSTREPNHTYWWRFERPRPAMRESLRRLSRFIAANRYGKRFLTCWQPTSVCPSGQIVVFAFEDDFSMGVLTSSIHSGWAWDQSSTLRVDLRYTPTSAFETFPWPTGARDEVDDLASRLIARRSEICLERQIGLTKLYNEVDDGAYRDLRELHDALDEAVAAAYGWPASAAHDPQESNRLLLELNRAITAGEIDYSPFG